MKKLAVFGMGKSGMSALKLAVKLGYESYAVNMGEPAKWGHFDEIQKLIPAERCVSQDDAFNLFVQMDLIVLSPGIDPTLGLLEMARDGSVPVISEIEFAWQNLGELKAPVVAITGTNGKTTTTTMIGEMFACCGKEVFVGGEYRNPVL